ncbi:MAG: TIGR03905 family TSCPD domain-containing protein [Bacteroidales bacterium]|nr:TIGR03905 family TSCPD domain-containing protein [Bacteroidales bacterium]
MKEIVYQTQGTCSQLIRLTGHEGRIVSVEFLGGCHGNLQGIASLVKGMKYQDVIDRTEGIRCGMKPTSCPDQLAHALRQLQAADHED